MSQIIQQWSIDKLIEYENNPRINDHAVDKIADAIKYYGFRIPIVIKSNGSVIDGHLRLKAARKLGLKEIPVVLADDLTDIQIKAFRLSVNKMAELADWDEDLLRIELDFLKDEDFDLSLTGFDLDDLNFYLEPEKLALTDEDNVPEPPADPVSKLGDVWLLGRHRVMVGDCRNFESVSKLMAGKKINVAITSPPYASQRKYDESSGFKPIPANEYVTWYQDVSSNIKANLAEDGSYFCNIKEHCEDGQRSLYVKELTLAHVREWGWMFVDEFVWKRGGVPGKWPNRFKNQWEPIFHFSKWNKIKMIHANVLHESDGAFTYSPDNPKSKTGFFSNKGRNDIAKEGMALPGNVLEIGTEVNQTENHSAPYPVALPEFFIKAFSDEKDCIFDPFLGSGSTLIAAEKTNRICYGMEISENYCDVIVKRWQDYTGKTAILESTGEKFP